QAVHRYVGDRGVAAGEDREARYIARRIVGEVGDDRKLLPAGRSIKDAIARQHLDLLQRRQARGVVAQALVEPGSDGLRGHAVGGKAGPALVRHAAEALQQNQTRRRVELVGTATENVAGELLVVHGGIEAAKTQAEPGLS